MTETTEGTDSAEATGDEPLADAGPAARRLRRPSRRAWAGAVIVAFAIAVLTVTVIRLHAPGAVELRYTVPAGTGDRIDRGEVVQIVPDDLSAKVGDVLVLDNQDTRAHVIGPFSVQAGQSMRFPFTQAGLYQGYCSIHANGQVVISVLE